MSCLVFICYSLNVIYIRYLSQCDIIVYCMWNVNNHIKGLFVNFYSMSKERTKQYRERLNQDEARREEILRERRRK